MNIAIVSRDVLLIFVITYLYILVISLIPAIRNSSIYIPVFIIGGNILLAITLFTLCGVLKQEGRVLHIFLVFFILWIIGGLEFKNISNSFSLHWLISGIFDLFYASIGCGISFLIKPTKKLQI